MRHETLGELDRVGCGQVRPFGAVEAASLGIPVSRLSTNTINSITPLDMFPQTAEIEVLAHLEARC
jgi:hypothetical protein